MRMRTGSRDGGALFVPLPKVDDTANRNAAVYADKQRKYVNLPRWQSSDRRREMGARHGRSASDDTICYSSTKTQCKLISSY